MNFVCVQNGKHLVTKMFSTVSEYKMVPTMLQFGYKMVTQWSPHRNGCKLVTKLCLNGYNMVTQWLQNGYNLVTPYKWLQNG